MEDEWRLGTLATDGQQLRENIEDNGEGESRAGDDRDGEPDWLVAQMHRNGVSNSGQDSHCVVLRIEGENHVAVLGGFDFGNYYCCPLNYGLIISRASATRPLPSQSHHSIHVR